MVEEPAQSYYIRASIVYATMDVARVKHVLYVLLTYIYIVYLTTYYV